MKARYEPVDVETVQDVIDKYNDCKLEESEDPEEWITRKDEIRLRLQIDFGKKDYEDDDFKAAVVHSLPELLEYGNNQYWYYGGNSRQKAYKDHKPSYLNLNGWIQRTSGRRRRIGDVISYVRLQDDLRRTCDRRSIRQTCVQSVNELMLTISYDYPCKALHTCTGT